MNYENVDENATYKIACENVKKIVNAIKALKIKYYPNFDRISEEDQKIYDDLQTKLETISQENGLNNLKEVLMQEVNSRYNREQANVDNGNIKPSDEVLKACYGATDAEVTALSSGKIKQAKKCQEILNEYLDGVNAQNYRELITEYRRRKFGELTRTRENKEEANEKWSNNLKLFYKPQDIEARRKIQGIIKNINREAVASTTKQNEDKTEDLEIG